MVVQRSETQGPRQMKQKFTILFVITSTVINCYVVALLIPHTIYMIDESLEESMKLGTQAISVTFYSLILATLETTFIVRLLVTFDKQSTSKLSKSLRIITWLIAIFMATLEICFILLTMLVGFGVKSGLFEWIGYIGYMMVFSYTSSSIFIVFIFAKKLHDIIQTELEISGWNNDGNGKIKHKNSTIKRCEFQICWLSIYY